MSSPIVNALVTYGLMSSGNRDQLNEWFTSLFTEIQQGRGQELLASSIVGRSYTFGNPNISISEAWSQLDEAINILSGRAMKKAIYRF